MQLRKILLMMTTVILLQSCASPYMGEELVQGKKTFAAGDYQTAFHQLLPIAVNGNKEAQYAVGYMYYNGVGVAQDTEAGYVWMRKSADQNYKPAVDALALLDASKK